MVEELEEADDDLENENEAEANAAEEEDDDDKFSVQAEPVLDNEE